MKKLIPLYFVAVLAGEANAQVVALVNSTSGTTTIFQTMDSAVNAAANNDLIYCSGGMVRWNVSGATSVSKKLNIYGAGIHFDSTSTTGITKFYQDGGGATSPNIRFSQAADNSFITGCDFTNYYINKEANSTSIYTINFQRCKFGNEIHGNGPINNSGSTTSPNFNYSECIINGSVLGGSGYVSNFSNCFITSIYDIAPGCTFNNCIIYPDDNASTNSPMGYASTFNNCIFYNIPAWIPNFLGHTPSNWVLNNCVFNGPNFIAASGGGGNVYNNCLFNVPASSLFVSAGTNGNWWHASDNFHLVAGSPALTAGIGGTQCGIYGGVNSAKAGLVPVNPHVSQSNIPAAATNGLLNVTINASAQQN